MRRARSTHTFRKALHGIAVPDPFSLDEFLASVAGRGRQVTVIEVPGAEPGWPGAWVSARQADLICLPTAASGPRRDQIVVHHLCHMLLGHRPRPAAGLAAVIAPDVGPQLVGLILGRDKARPADAPYADKTEQEQAANAMSSFILARGSRSPGPERPPSAATVPAPGGCPPASCAGPCPGYGCRPPAMRPATAERRRAARMSGRGSWRQASGSRRTE